MSVYTAHIDSNFSMEARIIKLTVPGSSISHKDLFVPGAPGLDLLMVSGPGAER